ncbi:MAG: hypothetical protein HQ515_07905, partial [Phycisphaeraceae bacterium]|nr:hypothetical protein [Phycisphaeraceae bacterium]
MKPAKRIEILVKGRRYKARAEAYDKTLKSFLQAVDEHIKNKTTRTESTRWRKIMRSHITRIAAAAVLLITACIIIHQSGSSIDGTSVVFAKMTENMKEMPWVHVVIEEERNEAHSKHEAWFCFEQQLGIGRADDGELTHADFRKRILQVFDPDVNTVTVSRMPPDTTFSFLAMPKQLIRNFEATLGENGTPESGTPESGRHQGRDVQIYR